MPGHGLEDGAAALENYRGDHGGFIPAPGNSFVRYYIRSFVPSFVCSFVSMFVRAFVRSFVRLLVRLVGLSAFQPLSHSKFTQSYEDIFTMIIKFIALFGLYPLILSNE